MKGSSKAFGTADSLGFLTPRIWEVVLGVGCGLHDLGLLVCVVV